MPYLGSEEFRAWAYSQRTTEEDQVLEKDKRLFKPSLDATVARVAKAFNIDEGSIYTAKRGEPNIPRWVAMYLGQEVCGLKLIDVANHFGLKRTGSIATTINKLKKLMNEDKQLSRKLLNLKASI